MVHTPGKRGDNEREEVMKARHATAWAVAALALVAMNSAARAADPLKTVVVDCAAGETIAKALTLGDERKPLLVQIVGTCSEHVLIDRNDVTLAAGASGATVSGPDPATDVIKVTARRVTIDGITVTGGRNGITGNSAPGLIVRNAAVQGTGRNGITYAHGASGVVNANNAAGNVISANASNGIHIVFGSGALIAMNQITGNGTSADPAALKIGINLASASADIIGGNTISGNVGTGVNLVRSSAIFGDALFGITTVNTISGNGSPASPGGVFAFLGSSVTIRDAIITGNMGTGVTLSLNSSSQIASTTIRNNLAIGPGTGDGIRLVFGSSLFATAPTGSITGNAGFGLTCSDGESSVINTALLGIGGNALGGVAASCTGF